MTSKLTRERLVKIKSWREIYGAGSNVMLPAVEAEALALIALAAMDSEPVALKPELAKVIYHFRDWNEGFPVERFKADYVISWMLANYPPAQPAKDREQVRREHAEWSQATFGSVGPVGPLKHLSKEALEAAAEPGDLSEWADMQFLLWDAQRRAGITDEQITQAMIEKLAVNKQRKWPAPKDGEPRLHIKEQPAPVVMDDKKLRELFDAWFASDCSFDQSPEASEADNIAWRESYWYVWQRCCAAMLQTKSLTSINPAPAMVFLPKNAKSLTGNSPVIPDGSADMLRRWLAFGCGMQNAGSQLPHNLIAETESMLADAPQEVNGE